MDSFLMIGQSNMAGRGALDEVPPILDSRLFMLRNGRWQPLCEPVNYDRPFAGIGLAPSFALEYAKKYEREVGLIPCADGGTSIREWEPGGLLYSHAVMMTKLALRTSRLKGILWHQGETDSDCKEDAERYLERLAVFFGHLLHDLGNPNVPVLIGELGNFLKDYPEGGDYYETVNRALREFSSRSPQYSFVPADGLTSNPDCLHFNAVSQREFGKRYFTAYRETAAQIKQAKKISSI